ncbi:MAG: crossover junction endodeoxyribonuclease RuvC [Lentisphaerae bacterium]|jgi:crossover junction endodeoxyribonuclease RuvC|nr:crossover junction endodeoxyribonuclease RuvC [Lentisphaerota bacterium]
MRIRNQEQLEKWLAMTKGPAATDSAAVSPAKRAPSPVPSKTAPQQRVLGIDTALRCTGWGLIDVHGNKLSAVDCGVIRNQNKDPISQCLRRLAGGIRELVELYHPQVAVIEGAFYCKNVRTAMVLGSARGAVIAVLAEHELPVFEYAPRRVKQSICGFGNASKQQVALLVAQFLNIHTEQIALDSTDALALALCHAQGLTIAQGLGLPNTI